MTLVLITFLLVVGIVYGAYWVFIVRPERQDRATLQKRLKGGGGEHKKPAPGRSVLKKEAKDPVALDSLNAVLKRATKQLAPLQRLIEQSGVNVTVSTLILISGCAAVVTLLLIIAFTSRPAIAFTVAPVAAVLPFMYVLRARTKRMLKFEEHFPEAIDLIARSLRAGHAFPTGLGMVADEVVAPVGPEFKIVHDQQNFGIPMSDALRGLAQRVNVIDVRFFVTAVLTQREAGGNLAEVLDNLSNVIRERCKVKRQVRVISAHGRMTGWILAGLPPALAVAFFFVVPKHLETLLGDPLGVQMVVGALCLQVVGTLIIRKIVQIEY